MGVDRSLGQLGQLGYLVRVLPIELTGCVIFILCFLEE